MVQSADRDQPPTASCALGRVHPLRSGDQAERRPSHTFSLGNATKLSYTKIRTARALQMAATQRTSSARFQVSFGAFEQ